MGDLAINKFGFHIYGSEGQLNVTTDKLLLQNIRRKGWQEIHRTSGEEHRLQVSEIIAWLDGQVHHHRGDAYQAKATLEILMAIFESVRTHGVVRPPLTIDISPLDFMVESGIL
jgi:hypothetical protein